MATLLSIHDRVKDAELPKSATPSQTATFLCVVMDYTRYLRLLSRPDKKEAQARERLTAQRFVRTISDSDAWPLAQQVAPEYQFPIEPADKPWLLQMVLQHLKTHLQPSEVVLPADDFAEWQRDNLWRRVLLNLEFLTFAWAQETEDTKRRMRQKKTGHQDMMKLLHDMYEARDSDGPEGEDDQDDPDPSDSDDEGEGDEESDEDDDNREDSDGPSSDQDEDDGDTRMGGVALTD